MTLISLLPEGFDGAVHTCDALSLLKRVPDESIDLVYMDPPFNTGRRQKRDRTRATRDVDGRVGFQGERYALEVIESRAFDDRYDDYLAFVRPIALEVKRILKGTGSFYFHGDHNEIHYVKVLLDSVFGRSAFINEIIWAYDYGGRSNKRWPRKHDTILFYARDPKRYFFDADAVERIPYMAPGLVSKEKAARGKRPTDTWWHTIVSPTGKEKLGYPTQKPLGVLKRVVDASCPEGGVVLDCFGGSGTTGAAALARGARFILGDRSPDAIEVMTKRFAESNVTFLE